jgi:hypothetical protein
VLGLVVVFGMVAAGDQSRPESTWRPGVLRYSPGWVPDGVVERQRVADPAKRTLRRSWWPVGQEPYYPNSVTFVVDSEPYETSAFEKSEPVSVNGVRGALITRTYRIREQEKADYGKENAAVAKVAWSPEWGVELVVSVVGIGNESESALRMARSVVRDLTTNFAESIAFPSDRRVTGMTVDGRSPADWHAYFEVSGSPRLPPYGPNRGSAVQIGPGECDRTGTPLPIRGRTGYLLFGPSTPKGGGSAVSVPLADGRCLTVTGMDSAENIQIAGEVTVPPTVYEWLGG